MQVDLEEAKTQENTKLQFALEEIQLQFQEANTLLIEELEAAKKAAEQAPIIQEVPVIDHEIVNKLTAENEQLKVRLLKLWYMLFLKKTLGLNQRHIKCLLVDVGCKYLLIIDDVILSLAICRLW